MKASPAVVVLSFALLPTTLAQNPTAAIPQGPPSDETYTYRSEGRRNPFVSPVNAGTEPRRTRSVEGPEGLTIAEVVVRGVLQSQDTIVAMIQGPTRKTYLVRAGDKLADGVIKAVIPEGLVILQDVSDPSSTVELREVRRLLRSIENAKP